MNGLRDAAGKAFEVIAIAALTLAGLVAVALYIIIAGFAFVLFGLIAATESVANAAQERRRRRA